VKVHNIKQRKRDHLLPVLLSLIGQPELTAAAKRGEITALPLPITSSAIASATYAVDGGVLTVTFRNGRTRTYNDVPMPVVIGFVIAGSKGAYYDRKIKGRY
jgi:hypothetical protein